MGLYPQVTERGAKSYIFRFWVAQRDALKSKLVRNPTTNKVKGKAREMGLGSLVTVSLHEARDRALECRKLRETASIRSRRASMESGRLPGAGAILEIQGRCGSIHSVAWSRLEKREARRAVVGNAGAYAYPQIGDLSIQTIDTTLVMKVFEPIWLTKPKTASRLRGRIEFVLDWATVRGYRQGEDPARWRGHLDKLLPARSKVRKAQHHSAIPFAELSSAQLSIMGPCSLSQFA